MAEVWVAAAATVLGAGISARAAKKGSRGVQSAADADRAQQQAQYAQTRADNRPFMEAGYDALKRQDAFLNGDMSGFENNAGYLFARQQGLQAADRGAAAGAGYRSGGADADRMNYANGLASQTADSYWSKLAGQTGMGGNSVNNVGQFGASAANQIGQAGYNAANARASSYNQSANAWGDAANSIAGLVNYGQQNNWGRTNQSPQGATNKGQR